MKMKILKKDGSYIDKLDALGRTPHQSNLNYLNRNPQIEKAIKDEVRMHIKEFLQSIRTNGKGYLNSAAVASEVSGKLKLQQDNKYGLVGSVLFEELEIYDCTLEGLDNQLVAVASKGDDQHFFDYFVDISTVKICDIY